MDIVDYSRLDVYNRREFGHLLKSGEGIATNILTDRLDKLQCFDIIIKKPHAAHGKKFIYQLTEQGLALAPTLIEFTLWSFETFADTRMPAHILQMMRHEKEQLISLINQRECLLELDL